MKKIVLAVIILIMFIAGCAHVPEIEEKDMPLCNRIVSENEAVKMAAIIEVNDLTQDKTKKLVIEMVKLFAVEEKKIKRLRILNEMMRLKPTTYVVIPLIIASASNLYLKDIVPVEDFIRMIKPSKKIKKKIHELMEQNDWKIRALCLAVLKMM